MIGIVFNLYVHLGRMDILTVLSLLVHDMVYFPFIWVFNFSQQYFINLSVQVLHVFIYLVALGLSCSRRDP